MQYTIQISPEIDAEVTTHIKLMGLKITNEQYIQMKVNSLLVELRNVTVNALAEKILALTPEKQDTITTIIHQV